MLKKRLKKLLEICINIFLANKKLYNLVLDCSFSADDKYENILSKIISSQKHLDSAVTRCIEDSKSYNRLCDLIGKDFQVGTKNIEKREAWLKKTLQSLQGGSMILDAGAGELQYQKFCTHLKYVSQDFAKYDGRGNYVGLQTQHWDNSKLDIISDITDIPVESETFDAVMCIEVFEHLPNPIEAIEEFHRILKNGGTLLLTAPFCSITHFAPYFYSNGYSRYWYEKILVESGFLIDELNPNGSYFEYLAQEINRIAFVARNYSNRELSREEELIRIGMLKMLEDLSENDNSSHDLLCFGYHVRARKIK